MKFGSKGYKKIFVLMSAEHENFSADKYENDVGIFIIYNSENGWMTCNLISF